MKKRSLGFKLIVGGIVTVLVPILMTGLYSLIKASDALDASAREKTAMAAYSLADMADMVFQEEAKFLSEMASRPAVKSAALRVKGTGPGEAAQEISALNQELTTSLKALGKDYELLIVVGLDGKLFADGLNGTQKGIDISARPYFQKAKAGQTAFSDPVISKASGKMVTPIAVPVKDDKGQVIAVMASVLKVDFLTDHLMDLKIGQDRLSLHLNTEGLVIGHPNKEHILKTDISKIPEMAGIYKATGSGKKGVEALSIWGRGQDRGLRADRADRLEHGGHPGRGRVSGHGA